MAQQQRNRSAGLVIGIILTGIVVGIPWAIGIAVLVQRVLNG